MNVCFSCGFDVPVWHSSKTCPAVCCKDGYQEGYERGNYKQYITVGHAPTMAGEHKDKMPSPGYEWDK